MIHTGRIQVYLFSNLYMSNSAPCFQVLEFGMLCTYDDSAFLCKCREPRRSPTYEAYPRSRRYALIGHYRRFLISGFLSRESNTLCTCLLKMYCTCRSRSRSHSPSHSRRYPRGGHSDDHRSKPRTTKIEYITEFGGSGDGVQPKLDRFSPPPSPPSQADMLNRSAHSTFNSCKDRFDSLYSAAAYPPFCYLRQNFLV